MEDDDLLKSHRFIILGDGHFNTLGMIRSLGEVGLRPDVVLVEHGHTAVSASKYIRHLHLVETYEAGLEYIISTYSKEKEKPIMLIGSDKIIAVINRNYNRLINILFSMPGKKDELTI